MGKGDEIGEIKENPDKIVEELRKLLGKVETFKKNKAKFLKMY